MTQPDIHQDLACPGANEEMLVRSTQRRDSFEQTQFLQDARCVGPEHHACAHFAKFIRPLVDRCLNACAMKCNSRRNAADAATDDADAEFRMTYQADFRVWMNRFHIDGSRGRRPSGTTGGEFAPVEAEVGDKQGNEREGDDTDGGEGVAKMAPVAGPEIEHAAGNKGKRDCIRASHPLAMLSDLAVTRGDEGGGGADDPRGSLHGGSG